MKDKVNKNIRVVYPPERVSSSFGNIHMFLAGTIDNGSSYNWQEDIIRIIEKKYKDNIPLVLYNPRRKDWDKTIKNEVYNPYLEQQVDWELSYIKNSDVVLMNFEKNSESPITLLELGLLADSSKLVVRCDKEYKRAGNVYKTCSFYNVMMVDTYEELVLEGIRMTGHV